MTTTPPTGRARSWAEMQFAASLVPCPYCGAPAGELKLVGDGDAWALTGPCPRCQAPRAFKFRSVGHPLKAPVPFRQLAGPGPSEIIRPGQFLAEHDRLTPAISDAPEQLEPAPWKANVTAIERALTCLYELRKFVPAGADAIPDAALDAAERADRAARADRYTAAWIDARIAELLAVRARHKADVGRIDALDAAAKQHAATAAAAPGPADDKQLEARALRAHAAWVRAGRRGEGRLAVADADASGTDFGAVDLTAAQLRQVNLARAGLDYAKLADAELVDCDARGARLASAALDGATIVRGTFADARMPLATLVRAKIDGTSFNGVEMPRSSWRDAQVRRAQLVTANLISAELAGAQFTGCDLRGADFSAEPDGPKATSRGARFEDCDLRETTWTGRDLAGAAFIRCKLGEIGGAPASLDGVEMVAPDVSVAGDGSDIADPAQLLAAWARGLH